MYLINLCICIAYVFVLSMYLYCLYIYIVYVFVLSMYFYIRSLREHPLIHVHILVRVHVQILVLIHIQIVVPIFGLQKTAQKLSQHMST